MAKNVIFLLGLLGFAVLVAAADKNPNVLTDKEKAEGWRLLFDGTSFDGWRGYRMAGIPKAGWEIKDGLLKTVPKVQGRDLVTTQKFNDFEFSWEWRIAPGGNNGIKYFVSEKRPDAPGHEYQMIDDAANEDVKEGAKSVTGAFYDVLAPVEDRPLKPAGEWNQSRVVVQGNHVEHWLNGEMVLEYELGSDRLKQGLANSKFKSVPGFGQKITGPIMLTYHYDECWFRNLKVRELSTK